MSDDSLDRDSNQDCKRSSDASSGLGQDSYSSVSQQTDSMSSLDSLRDESERHGALQSGSATIGLLQSDSMPRGSEIIQPQQSVSETSRKLENESDTNKTLRDDLAMNSKSQNGITALLNSKETHSSDLETNEGLQSSSETNRALQVGSEESTALNIGSEPSKMLQTCSEPSRALQMDSEPGRALQIDSERSRALQIDSEPKRALQIDCEASRALLKAENQVMNIATNTGHIHFIDDDVTSPDHVVTGSYPKVSESESRDHKDDSEDDGVEEAAVGVKFLDEDGDSICSSYSDDDQESEGHKGKAPDGGWGWVIVVASFFISTIADGISFSFGLLYVEFLKYFSASSWQTSLIGSLFMSIPLLTGPIGSALVDRYGCRKCTIVGGFLAGVGFVLSAFQTSLTMMYLTFGLVSGVGLGLCYVTAVVSIAYWFDRRRTLATGLGACGTGVGTVVFAPITSYCIAEYGWRGTILLLAGAMFNMCVCGALMRGPQWWADKAASIAGTKSLRESCGSVSALLDLPELRRMLQSGETLTPAALVDETEPFNLFHSAVALPTYVTHSDKYNELVGHYPGLLASRSLSDGSKVNIGAPVRARGRKITKQDTVESPQSPPSTQLVSSHPHFPSNPHLSSLPLLVSNPNLNGHLTSNPMYDASLPHIDDHITSSPLLNGHLQLDVSLPLLDEHLASLPLLDGQTTALKPAIKKTANKQQHYLRNIRVHRNSVMYRGAMLNTHRYRLRASSCPNIYRNSMTTIARENQERWYSDMLDLLCGMFRDFSMFRELHFLLMSVATILLFTWFIVPYFYIADHAQLNDYDDEQVASLFMIIGVTNFIGMVFLGWAGDQEWMHITKTYAGCLVACGLSTIAMPLCTRSYPLLCGACALFGLFSASSFPFTPVILVELIPLERFTTAYGLSLMCQGIGSLVGPPLAGWLYDMTRTYHLSFHMAGAWIIVAGLLVAVIPATDNRTLWGAGALEKSQEITVIAV